ncbi:DNA sulfur modification protein DndB [Amycolatopsis sp. NPDC051071]|uniref:DNA sulfur modification protein DndB n=1 Tax=Amycolatopsis sp. NPDC051071 TaxID=3154637 RepID=UPI0034377417
MTALSKFGGAAAPAWTSDFQFVRGEYAIGGEQVPYFCTTMKVEEARKYLNLARELAVDPDDPINIEELMQRDVDADRANSEIAEYLKQPARIKFFNSLTIVLVPVEKDGRSKNAFGENVLLPQDLVTDGFDLIQAGPVVARLLTGTDVGYLRWQPEHVRAIIIDGQHRFMALNAVHDEQPTTLKPHVTSIPVLILVLDPRAGFEPPTGGPSEITTASRSIFTDLNKHAVKVTPEREYLLDDRSVTAVCMRALITPGLRSEELPSTASWQAQIPLAAVDWVRTNRSKFDDGFSITTLQVLHQLVNDVVDSRQPSSSTDYEGMKAWVDQLTARLELEAVQGWSLDALDSRLKTDELEEAPFALLNSEVKAAGLGFRDSVGKVITAVLLAGLPYEELLSKYREVGLLGGTRELWLGQSSEGRNSYKATYADDPSPVASQIAAEVKGRYRLAYQVVFQRGFVLAAREIDSNRTVLAPLWNVDSGSREDVLAAWIVRFNDLARQTLTNEGLWTGAAVNSDGTIDYTQVSKTAIMGLVVLATTLDLPVGESSGAEQSDDAVRAMLRPSSSGDTALLAADPLALAEAEKIHVTGARRWLQALALGSRRQDGIAPLLRAAASAYRKGVRRYVIGLSKVDGQVLTKESLEELIKIHGARRLAHFAKLLAPASDPTPAAES